MLDQLEAMVLNLDREGVRAKVTQALEKGHSPSEIILHGLSKGMEAVGRRFEKGEYFLPQLIVSGQLMNSALEILKPHMKASGAGEVIKVLIATPKGDIHDIGKHIVKGLLEGNGFEVVDMGVNVPPEDIVRKAKETGVKIIGLSALISAGVSHAAQTITLLKEENVRVRVVIGGAATTAKTADSINADGYARDAWEGIKIIQAWAKGGR